MKLVRVLPVLASFAALVIACGSGSSNNAGGGFGGDDTAASGDDAGGGNNGNGTGFGNGNGSGDASSSDDANCAATLAEATKAKVDIIFVIDDSGSMTEEMAQIKVNVNTFAQQIGMSGLDYQVLFIVKKAKSATQTGNVICVPAPLAGAACADNAPLFHHIDQDVQSHNAFDLILSTYDSSNTALAWNKYLRADSYKVFVVVSDDEADLTYDKFDTQLLAKAPAGMFGTAAARKYIWHSICGWTDGQPVPSTKTCSTAVAPGSNYQNLSKLTGGIVDSVCKTDYSGVLNNMAKGITDKLGCQLAVPSSATSDPTKVVVQESPPTGAAKTLTQVTDVSKCATTPDGWYYDNATAPTQIILCPDTCTGANTVAGTKIEALVGCKAPPPK